MKRRLTLFVPAILILCVSVIASYRSDLLNDYAAYYDWYNESPPIARFFEEFSDSGLVVDPLFFFINSLFKSSIGWHPFLASIFFVSVYSKYLFARAYLGVHMSNIWLIMYFATNGLQFELVQFRYGLALGIFMYAISRKYPLLCIASASIHISLIWTIPVGLVLKYMNGIDLLRMAKLAAGAIFFPYLYLYYTKEESLIHQVNNLGGVGDADFFFIGKTLSQIASSTSVSSVYTISKLSIEVWLLMMIDHKDKKSRSLVYLYVFVLLLLYITANVDNFEARLVPILDIISLTLVLRMLNYKKQYIFSEIIMLYMISISSLMYGFFYFLSSPSMFA
jgi:hypothetical protein